MYFPYREIHFYIAGFCETTVVLEQIVIAHFFIVQLVIITLRHLATHVHDDTLSNGRTHHLAVKLGTPPFAVILPFE